MSADHVLVTGGAGFVGTEVVRRLAARGRALHVLCRASTSRAALEECDVRWHVAELEDRPALTAAFRSAAQSARAGGGSLDVVHLAARISYRRADQALLERANVLGTENVLAAARAADVRRLCHVSSVVALGPVASVADEKDDDAALGGLTLDSAYARTKARAEERVLAAARELDVVVASPAVVFGASRAGSNSQHFLARAVRGTLGPFSPPGSITVVGLDDAAAGIELVLQRGRRGVRYLLGESAWSLLDLLRLVRLSAGRRPPRARVAPALWRAVVGVAWTLDRLAPSERATPEALRLLGLHFRFRARRARAELGWNPRAFPEVLAPLLAGLQASAERHEAPHSTSSRGP